MKKQLIFILSFFLISSCTLFQDLEINGMDGIKLGKIEGKKLTINFGVKVENPNAYAIKIKPSTVDLFIDEDLVGKLVLTQTIKINKKKEDTYMVPLQIELADGSLLKFFKYTFKDKVTLRIKGKIKGSIWGISKKITIDEVKEIEGKLFNLESLMGK
jgi:LEA14-like dessication related protein